MTDDERELLEELLEAVRELRAEIRRLRTGELVARLPEAEREELAHRVHELLDERLAPRDDPEQQHDGAPARRQRGRGRYFRDR